MAMRQQWEYHTEQFEVEGWYIRPVTEYSSFQFRLDELGLEGWELVSAFDTNSKDGQSPQIVAVFKRLLSD